ncbi:GroES-like protein [Glonium stellatum]|uniref:GroES-like protein n=1 Tax=Glonium stellatum TaxID=574774 RepID=A0A8E2JQ49_9PEZI|nr:GroES-like protein [Glonium stellatum]
MSALRVQDIKDGKGPASSLFMSSETPRPVPNTGEALIKRSGNYPVPSQACKILGVEFSGTIVKVCDGKEKDNFVVGYEVFGLTYGGAYAEFVSVSTKMLIHKPNEISWEAAAGILEAWITAIQTMYFVANFAAGKSIPWHAGASSVSTAGIQLSKAYGESTIYTTAEKLLEATGGKEVDIIINFIEQSYFYRNLDSIALDGRIVIMGLLSGSEVPGRLDLQVFLVELALPKFANGTFRVPVEKIFDWKDIQETHALMESNMTKGKIICVVK